MAGVAAPAVAVVTVRKIVGGRVAASARDERDAATGALLLRAYAAPRGAPWPCCAGYDPGRLNLAVGAARAAGAVRMDPVEGAPAATLNFPAMIRCQNCETDFPTKYQYQRHQCDFDVEKVVLKPDADSSDSGKGSEKAKYECGTCGKHFVNKNNLERHQAGHENPKDNICEHCNKQFVSENRLRIHKENHCKKAGDISKFYRSDVTVWKCRKCHEVFSSMEIGNYHVSFCTEIIDTEEQQLKEDDSNCEGKDQGHVEINKNEDGQQKAHAQNKHIEKILTEILLQCEFCNRTYADKNLLLMHQRRHTTGKNYECVNCSETFESYTTAAAHWMKKCSDYANLFYLPKLTYCEYCDRTFKSHELLYTHKVKKKHYTPKLHLSTGVEAAGPSIAGTGVSVKEPPDEGDVDKAIYQLVQDVLQSLDPSDDANAGQNGVVGGIRIKSEPESEASTSAKENVEPIKRKRGRKRKWPRPAGESRGVSRRGGGLSTDEGFRYQCERCAAIFACVSRLEQHRDAEHVSNFSCEECGQVLQSAKALMIHSRAHKSLKPYVCDTCGRSYSQTSHLWQHMRFHQGIKPFACPHNGCEARYTIRPDLKDHIRKAHTRERPFRCAACGKCFLTGSVYYQHRLIHTNDRRYGCDVCQKRFFRADALNNHRRIHTDERPYPCEVCGREFRQKGDRNKHLKTQHPDAFSFA